MARSVHWATQSLPLQCEAGSIFLTHYDIWHRGAANKMAAQDGVRYMFKFQFMRMSSPRHSPLASMPRTVDWAVFEGEYAPAAIDPRKLAALEAAASSGDQAAAEFLRKCRAAQEVEAATRAERRAMWQQVWDWLCGRAQVDGAESDDVQGRGTQQGCRSAAAVFAGLQEVIVAGANLVELEPCYVAAAYSLTASTTEPALLATLLLQAFAPSSENSVVCVPKLAGLDNAPHTLMYALQSLGPAAALPALLAAPSVVQQSAYALAALEIVADQSRDLSVEQENAIVTLVQGVVQHGSGDRLVLQSAVQVLGALQCPVAIALALEIATNCSRPPDMRTTACYALLRHVSQGRLVQSNLAGPLRSDMQRVLEEVPVYRYVSAYAAEIVHRMDASEAALGREAKEDLEFAWGKVRFPTLVRWCLGGNGIMPTEDQEEKRREKGEEGTEKRREYLRVKKGAGLK